MARFIRDRVRSRLCRKRNRSYNRRAGRRLFHSMIRFIRRAIRRAIRSRTKNKNRGALSLRTLPGHMTGLAAAPAETRKWAGWGTVTKIAANRALRQLTRVPNATLAALPSNKARNILSNLNQPVYITQ